MKQRIVWLDSLKVFLILLVVVGHSIQEVGMHNFPGGEWIWYFIYSFHMMAFFAASGFLFYHKWSISENKKQFLFRREFTLFVPTAILSFFSILLFYVTHQCDSLWKAVLLTLNKFWFMGVLMLLELFYPLLLILFKNKRIYIECILLMGWLISGIWSNTVGKFLGYFFIFIFSGRLKDIIDNPKIQGAQIFFTRNICLVMFLVLLILCYQIQGIDSISNSYFKLLLGFFGSCWIFLLFPMYFGKRESGILSRLGHYTMQIYLVHQILFAFSKTFFAGFPSMPAAAYFVIFSAMGIGIPILLEKGMNKVPGLQFVFHPLHRVEKILCEG